MSPYWSWVLEGVGMTGAYFAGRKRWWAWVILFINAFLWVAYGIVSHQYGFAVASIFYVPIYARNAYRWHGQQKETVENKNEVEYHKCKKCGTMMYKATFSDRMLHSKNVSEHCPL
jgi:hypothetical protein